MDKPRKRNRTATRTILTLAAGATAALAAWWTVETANTLLNAGQWPETTTTGCWACDGERTADRTACIVCHYGDDGR